MVIQRKLKLMLISSYMLILIFSIYFKYFPTIINSTISNFFILIVTFLIIALLTYECFNLSSSIDFFLTVPQFLVFTFLVRAIPNIRFLYPPTHDSYYYYISTLNIINSYTLTPIFTSWYSSVDLLLHWPIMQILTVILVDITKINGFQFLRFQEPLMGMLFFTSVFILAKLITKNNNISLLTAFIASMSDVVIFYESEYHPQGLSVIFFIIIIYLFIKSRKSSNIGYLVLAFIFSVVFCFSHDFTPLFITFIIIEYTLLLLVINLLYNKTIFINNIFGNIKEMFNDYRFFMIFILLLYTYQVISYYKFLSLSNFMITSLPSLNAPLNPITSHIPLFTSILSSAKWVVFILSIISIFYILITKNINELRISLIFICIIFTGIIGNYIIAAPLDRIIAIYIPFASIFAALTIFRLKDTWFKKINNNIKTFICISIIAFIVLSGILNSQTPAYFFENSNQNTYYWNSNDLSSVQFYNNTGNWIKSYTSNESLYSLEFDTFILPFYANRSFDKVIDMSKMNTYSNSYFIVNPEITYNYKYTKQNYNKSIFLYYSNLYYTNGGLIVGTNKF